MKVFVYGTLRKNGCSQDKMRGTKYVGNAQIEGALYEVDWYPGVVLHLDDEWVTGEIYEVSESQLEDLDRYEGAEYERRLIQLKDGKGVTHTVFVWEYIKEVDSLKRIVSGDWIAFTESN